MNYFTFQEFLNENKEHFSEREVRCYAWLYFLQYPYLDSGMDIKEWEGDDRTGIAFEKAMKFLKEKNLVDFRNGRYFSSLDALPVLKRVFGSFKTRAEAEADERYEDYDTSEYKISQIGISMYEEDVRNAGPRDFKTIEERQMILDIRKWWEKYFREDHGWWYKLDKYLGKVGILFPKRKRYVYYRGLALSERIEVKMGEKIIDKRMSWSTSPEVAKKFAMGSKGPGDSTHMDRVAMGIVISYEFSPDEILFEIDYAQNLIEDGFNEHEVIVKPAKRKCTIEKIFYP
jgi:hypothetical protein